MHIAITLRTLLPILAIVLGIAALVAPRFLNYIVGAFLIQFNPPRTSLSVHFPLFGNGASITLSYSPAACRFTVFTKSWASLAG